VTDTETNLDFGFKRTDIRNTIQNR